MTSSLAPIVLFTYKRLDTLKQTIDALRQNYLAGESILYIFSDAAKTDKDLVAINEVRAFIHTITGFKQLEIVEASKNKGLASSIIDGVTSVINKHGKAIVLEDDLVSSKNFLSFLNGALNFYHDNETIFSVAGFSMPVRDASGDVYFTKRGSSWGWGTWKNQWNKVDWEVKDYKEFAKNEPVRMAFNKMGSDLSHMLDKQMRGSINSWAIRWCYYQFKHDLYTVHPVLSKIMNIGLESPDATHTNERFSRFKTVLDPIEATEFIFPDKAALDPKMIKQFVRPYSISQRVKYKLLNTLTGG